MGIVVKKAKEQIIRYMFQELSAEEIAKRLNYSISTIRRVFEELRDEYRVNSKVGIAKAYLRQKIAITKQNIEYILEIIN